MADFEYGPVEIFLIGFDGERPGPDVVNAIVDVVASGAIRLLDLLFITKSFESGDVTVLEIDEVADEYGLPEFELLEIGIAGEEDVADLAEDLEPGTSAALLVVEHLWAREFAQALFNAGGAVLRTERIPAPVVNEIAAMSGAE
jgi:hypothetical protein